MDMLGKLKTRVYKTIGSTPAISLEPLAHRRHVNSLVVSIDITFVDVCRNWVNWLPYLRRFARFGTKLRPATLLKLKLLAF